MSGDFVSFARAHGLMIDYAEPDNRWRRCKTVDKPRRRNGAFVYDGRRGAVRNWATMLDFATWSDGNFERVPLEQYREMRRKAAETRRKAAAEEARKHAKAAAEAARIVKAATLITPCAGRPWRPGRPAQEAVLAHPYLIKKSLPGEACLVHEGFLIVPMRVRGEHMDELVNVQRISPEGEKRFLPGGRAKGAFHRIGPARARETWICEGLATGLSLSQALKGMYRVAAVVVCFSAGNLKYPGATHAMADNDASGAGQKAAEETGLPWVMPPEVGQDANDLHAREGLGALQKLLRTVRGS
jgi:putative DNA primase/helicase